MSENDASTNPPSDEVRLLIARFCAEYTAELQAVRRGNVKQFVEQVPPEGRSELLRELFAIRCEYVGVDQIDKIAEMWRMVFPDFRLKSPAAASPKPPVIPAAKPVTPAEAAELPLDLLRRIDVVCLKFEEDLKSGRDPDVTLLARDFPSAGRAQLLAELLRIAMEYRQSAPVPPEASPVPISALEQTLIGVLGDLQPDVLGHAEHPAVVTPDQETRTYAGTPNIDASTVIGAPVVGKPVSAPQSLADYELLDELGRGGMGVVYKARQISLQRLVALKMVLRAEFASADDLVRFQQEAESAAQLDHPGIVPVFEVGETGGLPYFSMAFVEGPTLSKRLLEGPLGVQEAAELVRQLAVAVAYAHAKGIVHRDLKPGNVLLDKSGRPRITDFGLAKRLDSGQELTTTGQIVGTPSYMPPEQARGLVADVDGQSDVYSLGAVLYACLTGRPPFQAANPLDTLQQVIRGEIARPSMLNRSIPRDLEIICLKCLSKRKRDRYDSAAHLALDLGRWIKGEPIEARPISRVRRAWMWCRRRPVLAAASAVAIVSLITASIGGTIFTTRLQREIKFSRDETSRANRERDDAREQRARAIDASTRATTQLARAEQARYALQLTAIRQQIDARHFQRAETLLNECNWNLRGWEHRYLIGQLRRQAVVLSGQISPDAFSPDGRRLISYRPPPGGGNSSYASWPTGQAGWILWDTATGTEIARLSSQLQGLYRPQHNYQSPTFSPDGRWLAGTVTTYGAYGPDKNKRTTFVFEAETGRELWNQPDESLAGWDEQGRVVTATAVTVDGNGGNQFVLRDAATGKRVHDWPALAGSHGVRGVSSDGRRLFLCGRDKEWSSTDIVRAWDVGSPHPAFSLSPSQAFHMRLTPNRSWLLGSWENGSLTIRDAVTGEPSRQLVDPRMSSTFGWEYQVSPDARWLVDDVPWGDQSSNEKRTSLAVWDLTTGNKVWETDPAEGHWQPRFNADGSRLLTFGSQREGLTTRPRITLWDTPTGRRLFDLAGEPDGRGDGLSALFLGDGSSLAVRERFSEVRIVDATTGVELLRMNGHSRGIYNWASSPDGRQLATCNDHDRLLLWTLQPGPEVLTLRRPAKMEGSGNYSGGRCATFSHDGSRLAVAGGEQSAATVWDLAHGTELRTIRGTEGEPLRQAALSPDGKRLVTLGNRNSGGQWLQVHDVDSGERLRRWGDEFEWPVTWPGELHQLAVAPDNRTIYATTSSSRSDIPGNVVSLDIDSDRPPHHWIGAPTESDSRDSSLNTLAVVADGRRLALAGSEGNLLVWDIARFRPPPVATATKVPAERGRSAHVSITGGTFGGDPDNYPKIAARRTQYGHQDWWKPATISPDGRWAAFAVPQEARILIWNVDENRMTTTCVGHSGQIEALAFEPGGRLLSAALDQTLRVWDVTTGQELLSLPISLNRSFSPALAASRDRIALYGASSNEMVNVWTAAEATKAVYRRHQLSATGDQWRSIVGVALTHDGSLAASAAYDSVRIWERASGRDLLHLTADHVVGIEFSGDGRTLRVSRQNGWPIHVADYDVTTGEKLREVDTEPPRKSEGDKGPIVAVSPSGRRATGDAEGVVHVNSAGVERELARYTRAVSALAWSADSRVLIAGFTDGVVRVWDVPEDQ